MQQFVKMGRFLIQKRWNLSKPIRQSQDKPNLSIEIAGIKMQNPITVASGTFGLENKDFFDLSKLGAIVPKTVTLETREGNPPPRVMETPAGMLNAIGLQNKGIDHFIEKDLPKYLKLSIPVIVNISGKEESDYVECARKIDKTKVSAIELNVSCPNIKQGGIQFGIDPRAIHSIITKVKKTTKKPIVTKLTPNVTDITIPAKAAEDAGSDAISLINTLVGTSIDIKTKKFHLSNITGGLSGPAIKPVALRMVWQCANAVKIPIIGMGGITSAEDAIEFILAGATAVAIGTYNFVKPDVCEEIIRDIESYCVENNISDINDLRGKVGKL